MGSPSPKHTCLKLVISNKEQIFVKGTWFSSYFDLFITDGLHSWTCHGIFPFYWFRKIPTQKFYSHFFADLSLIGVLHFLLCNVLGGFLQRLRKRLKREHLSGINPFRSILIWVRSIQDFNNPVLFMGLMMLVLGTKGSAFLDFINILILVNCIFSVV